MIFSYRCSWENIWVLLTRWELSLFRFQGQTRLYKSKPSDFRMAIEEAMLAEDGILDPHLGPEQILEGAGSRADQEFYCQDQVILISFTLCYVSAYDTHYERTYKFSSTVLWACNIDYSGYTALVAIHLTKKASGFKSTRKYMLQPLMQLLHACWSLMS